MAKGQLAEAVDLVVADAVIDGSWAGRRLGLEPCVEDRDRGMPVQRAMGPLAVVVGAEGVELQLELWERGGRWLLAQEAFEGLVKSLHLGQSYRAPGPPGRRPRSGPAPGAQQTFGQVGDNRGRIPPVDCLDS
ncbi:MAG TPA: hypothetical protein VKI99_16220 [Candidatus Dormibacteraeota bacterium]|nr:hypothetical protein [Candidatus Dormibacteraeota bacterium]